MRLSVVGAGNGGLAVAGFAALQGADVRLYDIREEALRAVAEQSGIRVTGLHTGFAPISLTSISPAEAVAEADLVVLVVPGPDQAGAAHELAAHLPRSVQLLIKPGCTGGALEVASVLSRAGRRDVVIAETDAFAFACSMPEPGVSHITAVKHSFRVATLPGNLVAGALESVGKLFPQAYAAPGVLHTGFMNMNPVAHVAPVVANVGRIEHSSGGFEFYGEGITPSVARLIASYDAERLAVAAGFGVEVPSLTEWIAETYGVSESSLYQTIQVLNRDVYGSSPAPRSLDHRYLTEDIPCGTVPIAALGGAAGVSVPLHQHLIHLASTLSGRDYWRAGRTLEKLGVAGWRPDEIMEFATSGRHAEREAKEDSRRPNVPSS